MVVSSAYRVIDICNAAMGRSLSWKTNKRGHNNDPCGTPHFKGKKLTPLLRFSFCAIYLSGKAITRDWLDPGISFCII